MVTAVCVRLAWPASAPPPRMTTLLVRGVGATVLAALFLAPSVALLFALAVVPVSWLFIAAVPLALGVALVVHPIAVTGGWWKHPIPLRALGWVALSFAILTVAAAVIAVGPPWVVFVVAALSGAFNARAWVGMVGAVVEHRHSDRVVPAVPVALAVMAAVVAVGSVSGFTHVSAERTNAGPTTSYTAPRPRSASRAGGQRVRLALERGTDPPGPGTVLRATVSRTAASASSGRPLAYSSGDTVQTLHSLDVEVGLAGGRLGQGHRTTDRHRRRERGCSGGEDLSRLASADAPVGTVVLASPLLAPGRVSYPAAGSAAASGLPSRDALELLSRAYQSVAPIDLSPESRFLKSVDQLAPLLQGLLAAPPPVSAKWPCCPWPTPPPPRFAPHCPSPRWWCPPSTAGSSAAARADRIIAAALEGQVPVTSPGTPGPRQAHRPRPRRPGRFRPWSCPDYPRQPPQRQTLAATCSALAGALRT